MQSPDNMPEQAWTDTPPLPVNQGIGEQPVSATPVQQPYNIFRNIQLPNVSVSGTNRMNVGSVVPNIGAPDGNVGNVPLANQQAAQQAMNDAGMLQQQAKQAYQDTEAMIAAQQKSAIPQPQPQTPDPQLAQRAFEQGAADQMAGRYVQQNPQGVSVVPPIAEPTGNGKVPYVDAFTQLQEQKKKEVPTSKDGGKGLTNWIKNNLGGDGTKEGNRRAVQNIIALGNMLRHAANLRGTIHEATPQQIADQNAINEAKWKQEDALEQAQAEKQREFERKVRKDIADAEKAARDEKARDEGLKLKREGLERQKQKDADDKDARDKAYQLKVADAARADKKLDEDIKNNAIKARQKDEEIALGRGRLGVESARLAHQIEKDNNKETKGASHKFKDKNGKEHKGKVYTTPQGATYALSDSFLTSENVRKMYYKLPSDIRTKTEYKIDNNDSDPNKVYDKMLNAVLYGAGERKAYHDYFVYQGNRLGYNYIGGMSDADYAKLIGKPRGNNSLHLK